MKNDSLLIAILTIPGLALAAPDVPRESRVVTGQHAVVATDSEFASRAGLEILQAGGNAVDAAVAVSFALAVVRPYSTGLGGGAFTILRFADGRVFVQDARESAPAAARADMFVQALREHPEQSQPSRNGHLAVAVPGLVAGRCQLLERHGTLPLRRVIEPALRLAETGFPVDKHYVKAVERVSRIYAREPTLKARCPYVFHTHLRDGRLPKVGDVLKQPALARLLRAIGEGGSEFFYRGPVATAIAREMRQSGGILNAKDLFEYRVKQRKPIRATYRDFELILMPSPSSGGVAIAQTLNILEVIDHKTLTKTDPHLAVHYQIEAMKHAFADRARWFGDADFSTVPIDRLVSKTYARELAARLQPNAVQSSETYGTRHGTPQWPSDAGTSHFCIVDEAGNVVVSSETINTSFGSLVAVDEWGLILNNEMDDFVTTPGEPNAYGLVQSERNTIEPGKRPLSSMAPTIVLRNGSPYLLAGASGGPRIISSVLNVMLGVLDRGLSLDEAVSAYRPHHQWQPDLVYFDTAPPPEVATALIERGHRIAEKRKTGIVQAIMRTDAGWVGVSDPRKGGVPAGY
ncbi:MAG: gamma-glutamyltransferase [Planctomycetes bacterium]|nr:gamma-glutamyltransferase [Planctomycetota bacterium]